MAIFPAAAFSIVVTSSFCETFFKRKFEAPTAFARAMYVGLSTAEKMMTFVAEMLF